MKDVDAGNFTLEFAPDGHVPAEGQEHPRAIFRTVSPAFFATLGLPVIEGRDFTDGDRNGGELVAVVSQSLALRMFPKGDALNHHISWTDPLLKFAPFPGEFSGTERPEDPRH